MTQTIQAPNPATNTPTPVVGRNARIATNSGGWTIHNPADAKRPQRNVIQGMFDQLLRGGFVLPPPIKSHDGLIVLIRGKAGTGKSTLALQLAANLAPPTPNKSTPAREFFSLEQDPGELRSIYCRIVADQCRTRFSLLRTIVNPEAARLEVLHDMAEQLGCPPAEIEQISFPGAFPSAPDPNISKEEADEIFNDVIQLLAQHLLPSRILFNRIDGQSGTDPEQGKPDLTAECDFTSDPLSTAYEFIEQRRFLDRHERHERPFVFVDGLSMLREQDRHRLEMTSFIECLRRRCLIGVIAYEPSAGPEDSLDHQADVVIELQEKIAQGPVAYVLHELHFKKTRYQDAALGWHQYKIRGFGLEIYPSVHFQVHTHGYMTGQLLTSLVPVGQYQPAGNDKEPDVRSVDEQWSILEKVLGGINPGDSVALLGPRGGFKTTLTLDFLFRSCRGNCDPTVSTALPCSAAGAAEHSLLVSIIDNEKTLRGDQRCPLLRCWCGQDSTKSSAQCQNHVFLFYQRPGCIASSEFLYYLKTRLQLPEVAIDRLGFWDLTQLEYRFPLLANDPMFVPALLDLFKLGARAETAPRPPKKSQGIKAVFMGSVNGKLSNAISAVADNVVFCWRDRIRPGLSDSDRAVKDLEDKLKQLCLGRQGSVQPHAQSCGREYLMLYVDRTARSGGKEAKALFAFPIDNSELVVPKGEWDVTQHAIDTTLLYCWVNTADNVRYVTEMQGFGRHADAERTAENGKSVHQPERVRS